MKMSIEGAGAWIGATLGIFLVTVLEVVFTASGIYFLAEVFMKDPISFKDSLRAAAGLLLVASAVKRMQS